MLRRAGTGLIFQHKQTPLLADSINLSRRFLTKGGVRHSNSQRDETLGRFALIRNSDKVSMHHPASRLSSTTLTKFGRNISSKSKSQVEEGATSAENEETTADELPLEVPSNEGEVEYTLQLTDEEMQEITKGDPELIKKVKYIQLEHEVYRQEGLKVPKQVKMKNWKELLYLETRNARRKFYSFLWLNEMKMENDKIKKQQLREDRNKDSPLPPREQDPFGVDYGLGKNSLFLRLYDTTVNRYYHHRLVSAMMFSRPLVLDCGYDEFMNPREAKNCAKQIELMLTENRSHKQPYNIYLCNADPDSKIVDYLKRIIPPVFTDGYPLNITEKSYLELFPHKELVYLSPHAREVLEEYNEDEIYIVGAMVDKSDPRPFSLAKAKKENLRMKKLPLDNHLMWGLGTKSLTINQMANIMLDLRFTKNWTEALRHVPRRKLQREYHPYPNDEPESNAPRQPYRRESKSQVLEDFELINQRKGFRRSDSNPSGGFNRQNRFSYDNNNNSNRQERDNRGGNRSIRYDDD